MYQLNYYLRSNPSTLYPSFVQAACARRGDDTIHVSQSPNGRFSRQFDTVDDLVGDILYNQSHSLSYDGELRSDDGVSNRIFSADTPTIPIQWILDNAHRLYFTNITASSSLDGCRYVVEGIMGSEGMDWSLILHVKYF